MATLRTFIAIELDDVVKAGLRAVQEQLADRLPPRSVRWVGPDGIHLTLKFLGDTPLEKIEPIQAALTRAAAGVGPFSFTVGGVGCFPNSREPRVVWVGLAEPTGALTRLRTAVESHVAPLGFPTERRPFSPHLTLGRVGRYASRPDVRRIGEVVASTLVGTLGEMVVTAVCHTKSDLRPTGAVYAKLFQASLARRQASAPATLAQDER